MIATTPCIRLVLDRAATTAEAVELLSKYDMFASSGGITTSISPMLPVMAACWNTTAMTPPAP